MKKEKWGSILRKVQNWSSDGIWDEEVHFYKLHSFSKSKQGEGKKKTLRSVKRISYVSLWKLVKREKQGGGVAHGIFFNFLF